MDEARFQERVDELLLLEQRAERRASQFLELVESYELKSDVALNDLCKRIEGVNESLQKINAASSV